MSIAEFICDDPVGAAEMMGMDTFAFCPGMEEFEDEMRTKQEMDKFIKD